MIRLLGGLPREAGVAGAARAAGAATVLACLALFAPLLTAPPPTHAADCPKTSLADVENEVMCPVCGTPLALAPEAPQAKRERELILRLVDRCRSKEQIKAALVAEFGEGVLATPEDEGFDLAAYLVPALAILLAGAGIGVSAVRWRRRPPDASLDDDPPSGSPAREPHATGSPGGPDDPSGPPSRRGERERLEADLERYEL